VDFLLCAAVPLGRQKLFSCTPVSHYLFSASESMALSSLSLKPLRMQNKQLLWPARFHCAEQKGHSQGKSP